MGYSMPDFPVLHYLPKLIQTYLHWVDDTIQPFHPLSLLSPPALFFPSIRVFSKESALRIKWPKYWSFSLSNSPSNEYSRLISFWIDWFDLLAAQGTLKSPPAPQFEIINSSVLSLLYGPTLTSAHNYWKNQSFDEMDLCQQSNVSAFNMLSGFWFSSQNTLSTTFPASPLLSVVEWS